jgi:Ca2+-transporting ATPase
LQLLWINITATGPPALAVGLARTRGVMSLGPRPRDASLLDRRALRFVIVTGSFKASLGLLMLLLLPTFGFSTMETRTSVFLYETLAQLAYVYPSRQLHQPPQRNRVLNVIVVLSALLQPALVYVPATRRMLGLESIEPSAWATIVAGVLLSWLFSHFYCRWVRRATP